LKKVFWLLDVNSETRAQKPEIWIWGIDDKGQRILIIERNFTPYFYLVVREGQDPQTVTQNIMNRKEEFLSVLKLELVTKKYFGKSVKAVQVFCQNPDVVSKYAKAMAKIEGVKESLEDDIRYAMRYIIDTGASPCSWHEIEVQETKNALDIQVDRFYIARSPPRNVAKIEVPQLRIFGF
jgi:DNA polymerase I